MIAHCSTIYGAYYLLNQPASYSTDLFNISALDPPKPEHDDNKNMTIINIVTWTSIFHLFHPPQNMYWNTAPRQ